MSSSFHGTETESLTELLELTPFEQRMHGLEQTIDRLYRLSVVIRRPSIVSQNEKAAKFVMRDDEGNEVDFEPYALKRITHQLPEAPPYLLRRLAKAITERRRLFLYRRSHQRKLGSRSFSDSAENAPPVPSPSHEEESTIVGVHTVITSSPTKIRAGDTYLKPLISKTSATSASIFPHSQFRAEAVFESSSRVSTAFQSSVEERSSVQVPDPPPVNPGSKEFGCPYCCLMLPIDEAKRSKWR